jgi:hypothetical protein
LFVRNLDEMGTFCYTARMMIAELSSDSFIAVIGSAVAAHVSAPVLALCRKLIEAGHPSSASLDVYRARHARHLGPACENQASRVRNKTLKIPED